MRNTRGLVARARRAAESLMPDTCEVVAVTGRTTNPDGSVSPTYGPPVYAGKCKIQRLRGSFPQTPIAGEHLWTLESLELHVPVNGTAAISVDHRVRITASIESDNVGRVFRVKSDDRKSLQSAIRLQVEEVTG
ncbi:DUF6093 family protein [Amycolatopsis halotolerans]|uniref:DUF6093 family protein n=1 Tax=Amycolatopsis halotolerans TaxID=330083 RepID=A0ABV7QUY7_9PSEU